MSDRNEKKVIENATENLHEWIRARKYDSEDGDDAIRDLCALTARITDLEERERKAFEAGVEWGQERGIEGWFGRQMLDAFNSYLAIQAAEKERR